MNDKNNNLEKKNIPNKASPTTQIGIFSGPIPHPEVLARYNQIDETLVNRIVSMAENESSHRHRQETIELQARITHLKESDIDVKRGQVFAFIIVISFIVSGLLVALYGNPWAGGFISLGALAPIITAFIKGREITKD